MPWNQRNYPTSMKNLKPEVRRKAIEIGNRMLEKRSMPEGRVVAIATSQAERWARNRGMSVRKRGATRKRGRLPTTGQTDKGNNVHVFFSPDQKHWEVKKDRAKRASFTTSRKTEAVSRARRLAERENGGLIVHRRDGKIDRKENLRAKRGGEPQHVMYRDRLWVIQGEKNGKATKRFEKKSEAVARGKRIAKRKGAVLKVHSRDGKISNTYDFAISPPKAQAA